MTLVSTYDPTSTATCPYCGSVQCENTGGITFGLDPYLDFLHRECGTTWRWHMNTGVVESPIPKPMTLREMMGEKNWKSQELKIRVQSRAFEMLQALEAILAGDELGKEMATKVVDEVRRE